jgi:hypothetical protein
VFVHASFDFARPIRSLEHGLKRILDGRMPQVGIVVYNMDMHARGVKNKGKGA